MRYFPSFVLGLPGESKESLEATYRLCEEIVDPDRWSVPLRPFSCPFRFPSYAKLLQRLPAEGVDKADEIDLVPLEKYWADHYTSGSRDPRPIQTAYR